MGGTAHSKEPFGSIEADFGLGPVVIYYRKVNWRERNQLRRAHDISSDEFYIVNLIVRSRDEGGMRLWSKPEDRELMEREFDPDEIDRVVDLMYAKPDQAGN